MKQSSSTNSKSKIKETQNEFASLACQWVAQIAYARSDMEKSISSMSDDLLCAKLSQMQQHDTSGDRLSITAELTETDIGNLIQHIQFQDRVSQLLTHVEDSIRALPDVLDKIAQGVEEDNLESLDEIQQLKEAFHQSFSSAAEAGIHGVDYQVDNDDGLTFF